VHHLPEQFNNLTTLDALSKIQHEESTTNLLDITASSLFALFIACGGWEYENFDKHCNEAGKVYVFLAAKNEILTSESDKARLLSVYWSMDKEDRERIKKFILKHKNKEITHDLVHNTPDNTPCINYIRRIQKEDFHFGPCITPCHLYNYYFVKPNFSNERIRLQNGLFAIFGFSGDEQKTNAEFFASKIRSNIADGKILELTVINKAKILAELMLYFNNTKVSFTRDIQSVTEYIKNKEKIYKGYVE
jgi:hypothetical protein